MDLSPVERQWIVNTARRFARRRVKEFAGMEQGEYRVSLVIPMEDAIEHTPSHPFCDDPDCPCHTDGQLIEEYLDSPHRNGLLTTEEGLRLFTGRQV